ncbi:FAD-dependent monooxygenase [Sphingomonas cannabina]|uniref:FAD-dependent oxidoreductase n=1 Tax=Sphingomonas cannabina TaxID=2899123 RepID=UPI001F307670|nr:NAD(P)/FAD-dependent oxidoreductase [Sphingomonas cannabina]UIJ45897.1 FAD-dependent monooxygenase [Sphingomonas cannabina]
MRRLEVAVAGCGVAGLAAALLLRRDGHRVTLFERFAEPGPLGSGLMIQPTGQAVLRAMGAEAAVIAHGARIDRLAGEAGGSGRTVLDVRYAALGRAAYGIGIHRATLFHILYRLVLAEGITLEAGRTVQSAGEGRLRFADGSDAGPFDLIVDALGARSVLAGEPARTLPYGALWASVPWRGDFDPNALQQRYRAASVMAGVLPIGKPPGGAAPQCAFFWSLRGDRLSAWRADGLELWKAEVARLWPATQPLLDAITAPEQLTFAHYAHRTLARPWAPGLIHIGDAWHSTSPQLGQGANMALLDAYALTLALRAGDPAQAIRLRRGHVRLYQAMSALFTPVYQSDGRLLPFLRDWLVGPLSKRWPATRLQAAMVSGLVGDPLKTLGL